MRQAGRKHALSYPSVALHARFGNRRSRDGYTLVELIVSVALSSLLMVGLGSALLVGTRALDDGNTVRNRSEGAEVLSDVLRDLRLAKSFTEKTQTAVTFTVPDRDGDTFPETIRYSWAGGAGDPLLYKYNAELATPIAADVHNFDVSFLERSMGTAGGGSDVEYHEFTEGKATYNANSVTIALPPGTLDGDLLIAAVATDGNKASSLGEPGGWTVINVGSNGTSPTLGVWWKIASSEPSDFQFDWTGSGQEAYGWIMRFTGHDPTTPIHISATGNDNSQGPVSPAVNTTIDNTMIVRLGGFDDDNATPDDAGLAGHTTITSDESSSGSGTCSGAAGYVTQPIAGSSGTEPFTLTQPEKARMVTIAIAPAPCP